MLASANDSYDTLTPGTSYIPPASFGRFRLLHQIGAGVLGPVFRTHDPDGDRLVAVKAFAIDLTPEQAAELAAILDRLRFVELAGTSVAATIAAGVEDSVAYLAQQYVAGESLDAAVRQYGPAPAADAVRLISHVAAGLDDAARVGLFHGALHPRDILVTPGETHVTGFGVAAALEAVGHRAPIRRPYAAPERENGSAWGAASDIYALAAVSYEVLTGRRALPGTEHPLPGLSDVKVHDAGALYETIMAGLDPEPERRPASASAFAASYSAALAGGVRASGSERPGRQRRTRSRAARLPGLEDPLSTAAVVGPVAGLPHEIDQSLSIRDTRVDAQSEPDPIPVPADDRPAGQVFAVASVLPEPEPVVAPGAAVPDLGPVEALEVVPEPEPVMEPEAAVPDLEPVEALEVVPEPEPVMEPEAAVPDLEPVEALEVVPESEPVMAPEAMVAESPNKEALERALEPEVVTEAEAELAPGEGEADEGDGLAEGPGHDAEAAASLEAAHGELPGIDVTFTPDASDLHRAGYGPDLDLLSQALEAGSPAELEPAVEQPEDSVDAAVPAGEGEAAAPGDEAEPGPQLEFELGDEGRGVEDLAVGDEPSAREGDTEPALGRPFADESIDDFREPGSLVSEPPVPKALDLGGAGRSSPLPAGGDVRRGYLIVVGIAAAAFVLALVAYWSGAWRAFVGTPASPTPAGVASQAASEKPVPASPGSESRSSPAEPRPAPPSPPTAEPAAPPVKPSPPTAEPAALPVKPSPLPTGQVRVTSTPATADVFVNGDRRGVTPRTLRDLPLGTYTIRVSRPGYASEDKVVTISPDRPSARVTFSLARLRPTVPPAAPKPRPPVGKSAPASKSPAASARKPVPVVGSISVETRPGGARVVIDGRNVGTSPLVVPGIAPGKHEVRLELPGYRPWVTSITMAPGERRRVTASLERVPPR